jgi:hypothetical protein
MRYSLNLDNGEFLRLGETFEWRGNVYRLDKINKVNAQITGADGKNYNLHWSSITRSATKSDVVITDKSIVDKRRERQVERHVVADGDKIKPGMVVTYSREPGLWVVLKFQSRSNRFDIVKLGGDPQGREWGWRTPASTLTPVDAINQMTG